MINFRYNIIDKIGEGGSGEVLLAEDTCRKHQRVAVKVLHAAEQIGTEALEAFQNEVSSLVNLSHPNLIKILDYGTIRHSPREALQHRRYFTMELMRGVDALRWSSSCRGQQHFESTLELLLLQALSVLSYIHHEGVIHFDVKPENLAVVGDGETGSVPILKLVDFGFSRRQGESQSVSTRGTLHYTAPELLTGGAVDHRADLYSVGATFFHLLEGRPPFEATTPVELTKRILSDDVAFTQPEGGSRQRLQMVVTALMQKAPSARCRSAEEAARLLVSGIPHGKELFESYFGFSRAPKFVGRAAEMATMHAAIASLGQESTPIHEVAVLVSGLEGIGKTTLVHETLKQARAQEIPVYHIEAQQSEVPFEAIAALLSPLIADVQAVSETGQEVFAKYNSLLDFEREENVRFERWGLNKESTVELMARFLLECSAVYHFIISVDNAQFLDDASLSVLRTTARDAAGGRLLVILAQTPDGATVMQGPFLREIPLGELAVEEVALMSMSMLPPDSFAGEIGTHLYSLYGGRPGVVVEAINAVRELMTDEPPVPTATASDYIATLESKLPRTIDDFLAARFEKLGKERQLLLNMLSCFRFPVETRTLLQLLPFHAHRAADHLRFLQLDGFISAIDGNVSIRMMRLKDSIYALITAERRELHAMIASILEQDVEVSGDFTRLQELAYQFSQAGIPGKAAACYEKAADEGSRLFALQRSVQLYREAIDHARGTSDSGVQQRLNVKYGSALYRAGMYQEAIRLGKQLVGAAGLLEHERMTVRKVVGLASSRLGENDDARTYLTDALTLATDPLERLEIRQELVGLMISSGDFSFAEKECREQLARATAPGTTRLVGAIYTDMGIAMFFQDRFDDAVECFGEALKRYESLNERIQVINSMNNIGNALSAKGDAPKAIEFWSRALKESQEFGSTNQQAQIYNNLGIAHYTLKKFDKAKGFYAEARRRYERVNSMLGLATVLMNLGEVLLAEGEYEAALQRLLEANDLYTTMENSYFQVQSGLYIAQTLLMLGNPGGALPRLEEAERLIRDKKQESFLARHRYLRGMVRIRQNRPNDALPDLQEAIEAGLKEKAGEVVWLAQIRLAECMMKLGRKGDALEIVNAVLANEGASAQRHIVAEADFLLGTLASGEAGHRLDRPIMYFKHGLDSIAHEPVSEMTWKLAFALAREYYERGQREKAKEFLLKTRLILQFFLSHFTSNELKKSYLAVDDKERVFSTIERIIKP